MADLLHVIERKSAAGEPGGDESDGDDMEEGEDAESSGDEESEEEEEMEDEEKNNALPSAMVGLFTRDCLLVRLNNICE